MVYYLINIDNLFYGKENNTHGRILKINTVEDSLLPYIIKEIGYTSKNGALKAARKIQKLKNLKSNQIKIDGIIIN